MLLKNIDLTAALRPSYLPDEVLLFVQDNVGLYEGKFKLPDHQIGQVYLTSHRICYVDQKNPRANSAALELKDVDRYEFYAGFLKSSAKVTIVPKPLRRSALRSHAVSNAASPSRGSSASPAHHDSGYMRPQESPQVTAVTWVCTICSFSNPLPSNFDPSAANAHTPLPPCLACGIKPTLSHVLKAAISHASNRSWPVQGPVHGTSLAVRPKGPDSTEQQTQTGDASHTNQQADPDASFQCPKCTFSNHPSLLSCEMCSTSLISRRVPVLPSDGTIRTQSPGPVMDDKGRAAHRDVDAVESIKISFRGGGEKIFYERLKGAMTQRKWLLQNAPPAPQSARRARDAVDGSSSSQSEAKPKAAGIAGLEQMEMSMHKNNEMLIGSAFEDLETLMASAKEVIELAERFSRQGGAGASSESNALLAESASQLGLVATKDIVGGGGNSSESLYLSELSRNIAEFVSDDSRAVLKRAGGIITVVDLWAQFNTVRGGVELVSPKDFAKAVQLWESLKLPVRLRTFRSGVMVVQASDRTDEATIRSLLAWLQDLHEFPPERDVAWDWHRFGRGVTAHETAERFGWSLGVAEEELTMAEESGAVCREGGIEGLKYWKNYIDTGDVPPPKSEAALQHEAICNALRDAGFF